MVRQAAGDFSAAGLALCTPCSRRTRITSSTAQTELVLVNVTVRDKNGNFVRDLKPEDFNVLEDGKPQKVVSFDIENTDAVARHRCGPGQAAQHAATEASAPATPQAKSPTLWALSKTAA